MGDAKSVDTDFDSECVGYPTESAKVPAEWKKDKTYLYVSGKPGLQNTGHDQGILLNTDGSEKYSAAEKKEIIEFLKTL
jgi:hypothetical protein